MVFELLLSNIFVSTQHSKIALRMCLTFIIYYVQALTTLLFTALLKELS